MNPGSDSSKYFQHAVWFLQMLLQREGQKHLQATVNFEGRKYRLEFEDIGEADPPEKEKKNG
jgi:hypothetical protein